MKFTIKEIPELKVRSVSMVCDSSDQDDIRIKKAGLPPKNSAVLFCGGPGSGKSNLVFDLLHNKHFYKRFFDVIDIYSPSLHTFGKPFKVQEDNLHSDFNLEEIEGILADYDPEQKRLIIFDDMISNLNSVGKTSIIRKMILNRRHLFTSVFITSQRYILLDKSLRVNLSHLILFKLPRQELEAIYDEKISGVSKDEFLEICDFVFDEPHNFMYLQLTPTLKYHKNFNQIIIS